MRFIDEYRDKEIIKGLAELIGKSAVREYRFMEVCGGHTAAIHRFGIPSMLPANIRLLSGPGCPVCVTGSGYIDKIIGLSRLPDVTIAAFGDLIRIPGSSSSLEKEIRNGADVRIVFSGLEALDIARKTPGRRVVFAGIGFETTAPGTAATIKEARKTSTRNFMVVSAHKVMPPAMEALVSSGANINGFICPGHVATITGLSAFSFIPIRYKTGCVITGFEPADILQAIYMLILQVNNGTPAAEIQYRRAVKSSGNKVALSIMDEVFEPRDDYWRGIGLIPGSGLAIREEFGRWNAEGLVRDFPDEHREAEDCICGSILRGISNPDECRLFGKICTPEDPVGACMVSGEGACNAWFKYRNNG